MPTERLSTLDQAELKLKTAQLAMAESRTRLFDEEGRKARVEADAVEREYQQILASEGDNRIYTFDSQVGATSVQFCIRELGCWARMDPNKPITIVFNSPGGSVFDGLALYDFIQTLRDDGTRVDTKGIGMAASMGGILLQAGEERTMTLNSYMLIHEVSTGAFGNMSELKDKVKFTDRLQDRCLAILAERSTMSKDEIRDKWERKDWWLDAQEALEKGFVDRVE